MFGVMKPTNDLSWLVTAPLSTLSLIGHGPSFQRRSFSRRISRDSPTVTAHVGKLFFWLSELYCL